MTYKNNVPGYYPCICKDTIYLVQGDVCDPLGVASESGSEMMIWAFLPDLVNKKKLHTDKLNHNPIMTSVQGLQWLREHQRGDKILQQYTVRAYPSRGQSFSTAAFCSQEIPQ